MKIKVTYYVLCIMGTLLFTAPLLLNTYPVTPVFAVDSTPSADIKAKLKALQEEIASRASQLKQEVSKAMQNKVYTGLVKAVSAGSITLTTAGGEKNITLNEFTDYVGKGKAANLKSLTTGTYIAALGDLDEKEVLTAKRVAMFEAPPSEKGVVFGSVISIASGKMGFLTKDKQALNLVINKYTEYRAPKDQVLSSKDLKVGQVLIIVVSKEKDISYADFIYAPSSTSSPKPKVASPSAKITTPSSSSNTKTVTGK